MSYFSESSTVFQKSLQVFKRRFCADSNSEKSDPMLCTDGQVMRPDSRQCQEASNSSRLHPPGHHGSTSGRQTKFEKYSDFLFRHVYGETAASVRTTGQHRLNEVLNKAIRREELQPSERPCNTVQTRSLLWKLHVAELQPSGL
jgi:hypothetical protein